MLTARGHERIGSADLRWALVFTPRLWCIASERNGLVLDTRFVPAAVEAARGTSCLYLLLNGFFAIHRDAGPCFDAPSALRLSDEHLEGARGARHSRSRRPAAAALWRALRPMIERLYLTPTLQEVVDVTGVSVRQADRIIQDFVASFALVGQGWRPATRHLRLKLAPRARVERMAESIGRWPKRRWL